MILTVMICTSLMISLVAFGTYVVKTNGIVKHPTKHTPRKYIPRKHTRKTSSAQILLNLHNRVRNKNHPLKLDADMNAKAQWWAEMMAKDQNFTHSQMNYAENIAKGHRSEQHVFNEWMKSWGHKNNIIRESHTHAGFGVARDAEGKLWWCAIFR